MAMNQYITSAVITFVATFLVVLGQSLLAANPVQWTAAGLFSLIVTVFRTIIVKPAGETVLRSA